MSKFFNRLNKTSFKVLVEFHIHFFEININTPCRAKILIEKGFVHLIVLKCFNEIIRFKILVIEE